MGPTNYSGFSRNPRLSVANQATALKAVVHLHRVYSYNGPGGISGPDALIGTANFQVNVISSVPEPASASLALLGFGGFAAALLRRRLAR